MKYMLLLYGLEVETPEDELTDLLSRHVAYEKALLDGGHLVSSEALSPVDTATTVVVSDSGEQTVTDGPFAETREVLGGYYLIDVPDLDAAVHWASRCPTSPGDKVEVRPVWDTSEAMGAG